MLKGIYNKDNAYEYPYSHWHSFYEIYYLISGRRRYVIENRIYDLSAGDIILIPSMTSHRTLPVPGTPKDEIHERYLFEVNENVIPQELRDCFNQNHYRLSGEEGEKIRVLIEETVKAEHDKPKNLQLLKLLNMEKLLYFLSASENCITASTLTTKTDRIIQSAANYIKENCTESITLKDVAEKFFFSKEYFSSLFKESIGYGFSEYLTLMRLAIALKLLKETKLSISEISEHCGFNDSNYFSTIFKKNLGISPREYRKG